jgi:hypothetical protein
MIGLGNSFGTFFFVGTMRRRRHESAFRGLPVKLSRRNRAPSTKAGNVAHNRRKLLAAIAPESIRNNKRVRITGTFVSKIRDDS